MKVNTNPALGVALAASAVALAFPLAMEVTNNDWRERVEPETGALVPPYAGYPTGPAPVRVAVRDLDHLKRSLSNIEQLNALAGVAPEGGLWIGTIEVTDADVVDTEVSVDAQPGADHNPDKKPAGARKKT